MEQAIADAESAATVRRLANGMFVLLEPLPYLHSVACGMWIKTGSANEPADQAGVSHFLEHLFFKGTTTRTARQIVEPIEGCGGHINAFTTRDYTCVYAKVLDTHCATALEIIADIVKNSQLSELEKERNVVLEEIASIEDVPEDHAHDLFTMRLWPGHSLGRPITGSPQTVSKIGLNEMRAYYQAWYQPQNMLFSVAGNFDEAAVFEQIRNEFDLLDPVAGNDCYKAPQYGACIDYVERDIAQNHVCFGFPGPKATDPQRYVYDVLSSALGGGSMSRLFQRIREDEGLAYSIYTFHSCYFEAGLFGVCAAVAPENLNKTIDLTFEELRKLREKPLEEDEVAFNREQLKGSLLLALENTNNRMGHMAKSMMYLGRVIPVEEIVSSVDAVTAEDMHRLAQELFTPDHCAMVVLGPSPDQRIEALPL